MVRVNNITLMVVDMKVNLQMVKEMEMGSFTMQMVILTKDSLNKEKEKVMELVIIQMGLAIKDILRMIKGREKVKKS